jgi:hypothetical protein
MSFGKRHGGPSAPQELPPASAHALSALPSSQLIAPNPIEIRKDQGKAVTSGAISGVEKFLLETYDDRSGGNAETMLSAAGALAGFAAQEAVWEGIVRPGRTPAAKAFVRVETKSGETYFFGAAVDALLASLEKTQFSIWTLITMAAVTSDAPSLPELGPIFEHCRETVGTPAFDVPILPGHLALKESPRQALRHWPAIKSMLLAGNVPPLRWPLEIATAAKELILQNKDVLSGDIGALVVMQAAIRMSRVDPRKVPGGATAF